jgi:hypothetical protein
MSIAVDTGKPVVVVDTSRPVGTVDTSRPEHVRQWAQSKAPQTCKLSLV